MLLKVVLPKGMRSIGFDVLLDEKTLARKALLVGKPTNRAFLFSLMSPTIVYGEPLGVHLSQQSHGGSK